MNTVENPNITEEVLSEDAVSETPMPDTPAEAENAPQPMELSACIYHGIVFEDPEAVALAKQEEARLEGVMRSLNRESLDSVDAAIAQVNVSPSPIKKLYLDTLQSLRLELVRNGCTFRGVLYESPAYAEHAKQVYAWAQGIYNSLDLSDPVTVTAARDHLAATGHKATDEFVAKLNQILGELDARDRTVNGILFDTREQAEVARQELSAIQAAVTAVRVDDEPSMLAAKKVLSECTTPIREPYLQRIEQLLTDYDIKMRTFRGTLYDTREEVALLEQEAAKIREILTGMNQASEASMLEARDALEALTTELREPPLSTVRALLNEYDTRLRTFNGVLYDTRDEAIAVAQEHQTALTIRQQVDPEDEQSILDAQAAMQALTTSVKEGHLAELQSMWEAYDKKQRTFGNVLFDTREDAQLARSTYQEFITRFNTMDLSQGANLVLLEQYITETLQEKLRDYANGLISNVRMVHTRIAYIVRTDAAINPSTQKQESANLYQFIEETIPLMTKYRFNTEQMEALKKKHYASLNVGKKFLNFFKK